MNPILKGIIISISIIVGFLLAIFGIVAFLSVVLSDQNTPWFFLAFAWIGTPVVTVGIMLAGLYKYFKMKSKVGIGLLLGPIILLVLFQFTFLLNFIQ